MSKKVVTAKDGKIRQGRKRWSVSEGGEVKY